MFKALIDRLFAPRHLERRALVIALLLGPVGTAHAATVAAFEWVPVVGAGAGSLSLSLPDSITSSTFNTGNLGATAAAAAITAFSYTFSNALTVGLADLTSRSITSNTWATSNVINPGFGAPSDVYLISNFQLAGSKVFPGSPSAALFNIASAGGLISGPLGFANNGVTPFVGAAANDAGFWRLTSLSTASPVPLPAAAWLFGSGLFGFLAVARRRRDAARGRAPAVLAA